MTRLRLMAAPLAASALLFPGHGGCVPTPNPTTADPVVQFAAPASTQISDGNLAYGAIRVVAFDPDRGETDGAGIRSVTLAIVDAASGKVVKRRTERFASYDFGARLAPGTYRLDATARSTRGAGGSRTTASITIDVIGGTAPTTTTPAATTPATTIAPDQGAATTASLTLLNGERAAVGVTALQIDPAMSQFALDWSRTMAATGFRHSSGGYAENIAWTSDTSMTPEQAAAYFNTAWRNSRGHYANMTNAGYTHVGIGLHLDANGWWATHVFR